MRKCGEDIEVTGEDKDIILNFMEKCETDETYLPTDEEMEVLKRYGILDDLLGEEDEDEDEEYEYKEAVGMDIDVENIQYHKLDTKEYDRGLKEASYYVGFVSALKTVNYPTNLIHQLLMNSQTCESNLAVSRQSALNIEKNMI